MVLKLARSSKEDIKALLRNSFIIIDEAHLLRDSTVSKTFPLLLSVFRELWEERCIKVMLLTGTPITDSIDDFHGLMKLLD
ncbi:hypothetical protein EC988_000008, partial [Linderina pennispora]